MIDRLTAKPIPRPFALEVTNGLNKVSLIDRDGKLEKFDLKTKREVAGDIYLRIKKMIGNA